MDFEKGYSKKKVIFFLLPALSSKMVMVSGYKFIEIQSAVGCVAEQLNALLGELVSLHHFRLSLQLCNRLNTG